MYPLEKKVPLGKQQKKRTNKLKGYIHDFLINEGLVGVILKEVEVRRPSAAICLGKGLDPSGSEIQFYTDFSMQKRIEFQRG